MQNVLDIDTTSTAQFDSEEAAFLALLELVVEARQCMSKLFAWWAVSHREFGERPWSSHRYRIRFAKRTARLGKRLCTTCFAIDDLTSEHRANLRGHYHFQHTTTEFGQHLTEAIAAAQAHDDDHDGQKLYYAHTSLLALITRCESELRTRTLLAEASDDGRALAASVRKLLAER